MKEGASREHFCDMIIFLSGQDLLKIGITVKLKGPLVKGVGASLSVPNIIELQCYSKGEPIILYLIRILCITSIF